MAVGTRITFTGRSVKLLYNMKKSYSKLMDKQMELSDGKKIHRPSDSPINVTNSLNIRTKDYQNKQYQRNIEDGKALLVTNDTTLQTVVNSLQRERELAVQGRTDTISGVERKSIGDEVTENLRSILGKLNSKFKGKYIFNGTQTDKPPYELRSETGETISVAPADVGTGIQVGSLLSPPTKKIIPSTATVKDSTGAVTYKEGVDYSLNYINGKIVPISGGALDNGSTNDIVINYESIKKSDYTNNEKIERQISEQDKLSINLSASEIVDDPSSGSDLLDKLINLSDGLWTNDTTKIGESIDQIDSGRDLVLRSLAKNGAKINIFDEQKSNINSEKIEIDDLLGQFEDIDYAQTITEFSMQQNLMQSSMKAGAQIVQNFIGNFM